MISLEEKLKNPVWYSLMETHKNHCLDFDNIKFYKPKICSFGAFYNESKTKKALSEYINLIDECFYVSENQNPIFDEKKVHLHKKINGCQMILDKLIPVTINEEIIPLTGKHIQKVYDLIWLTMPGFYQKGGFEMGKFYGIFKDKKLVSISGQRMQADDFIEISSVVTHPNYTKRGYASQLINYITKDIINDNKLPILHTNKGNLAIPLYEKLGFKITRDMNWWYFKSVKQ